MNDIVKAFGGADNMPTAFDPTALMQSAAALPKSSDKPYLVYKDGEWTYGADAAEVEDGVKWAVNPNSFMFGLIEWLDSKAGAEIYVPAGQPYNAGDLNLEYDSTDANHRIAPQIGCEMLCLEGGDEGLEVHYKVSTRGGVDALNKLAQQIAKQSQSDQPGHIVAIVKLGSDSYMHTKYKRKNYVPVIDTLYFDTFDLEATKGDDKPKKKKAKPIAKQRRKPEPVEEAVNDDTFEEVVEEVEEVVEEAFEEVVQEMVDEAPPTRRRRRR